MKKREILQLIKNNEYVPFNDFVNSGVDIDQLIYGKSLLTQAVVCNSDHCVHLLFMMGAEIEDLKRLKNWQKRLAEIDPLYLEMVKEMEESSQREDSLTIRSIMKETSRSLLGNKPFSYRNVLQYRDGTGNYQKLWVGLHLFEYRNFNFLFTQLHDVFQCEKNLIPDLSKVPQTKWVTIVSSVLRDDEIDKIPGMSHRITAFLTLTQIPVQQLNDELGKINEDDELFIGLHFSDESTLRYNEYSNTLDVDMKFFDSMKDVICRKSNPSYQENRPDPILVAKMFTFNNLMNWDHQLNSWIKEFKSDYGYFPNFLLASTETYARIDLVANARGKDHLRNTEGETAPEGEFVSMNGMRGDGYEIDFCIDDGLGVDTVRLIYDSDPDGGLPIPESEAVVNIKVS